jgi:hypothetical protein
MLQEIAAFGSLALEAVKSLRLTRSNRAVIASAVGTIYRELSALVHNGERILRMLRQHNRGKDIALDILGQLIREQQVIIGRINATLKQRKVKTALSIHAPRLSPLQMLLLGKEARLVLLRGEIEPARDRHAEPLPIELILASRRVKLPSNSVLDQSGRELRKIKAQAEELRGFIVENFKVHEVV